MNIFNLKICFYFTVFLSMNIFPQTKTDGWEESGRYNKLFSNKIDTVSGIVLNVLLASPMPGMAQGVQLQVLSGKDTVTVHLCPKWVGVYLNLNIQPKQQVVIEGCRAVCKGAHVFMASKLTADTIILQLRDDKGSPIWDKLR